LSFVSDENHRFPFDFPHRMKRGARKEPMTAGKNVLAANNLEPEMKAPSVASPPNVNSAHCFATHRCSDAKIRMGASNLNVPVCSKEAGPLAVHRMAVGSAMKAFGSSIPMTLFPRFVSFPYASRVSG